MDAGGAANLPGSETPSLAALAVLFLRLGLTAFGGPAAHLAMMEEEVVRRRRWLTRERFLDLFAATNLIPGPNSTEMAIHIGLLAGWRGLVIAGLCFILPATLLTGVLAWAYKSYGTLPQAAGILFGIKPVVIAIVAQALWRFGRTSITTWPRAGLVFLAVLCKVLGADELVVLLACGGLVALRRWLANRRRSGATPAGWPALPISATVSAITGTATAPVGLWPIFLVFLKVGSVLYGSGYVLLAFLRTELVERRHWLEEPELLDAVAAGQVTPGPVSSTATFVGYLLADWQGAVAATAGMFLPAFVFVAVSGPLVPRLRRSPLASAFLDGVVLGSLALMAVVTLELARAAVVDWRGTVLLVLAAAVLFRFRINAAWLLLAGGLLGWVNQAYSI